MTDIRCATCRFWDPYYDVSGNCQRYAPKPTLVRSRLEVNNSDLTEALWPITSADDYCGEWEASK